MITILINFLRDENFANVRLEKISGSKQAPWVFFPFS